MDLNKTDPSDADPAPPYTEGNPQETIPAENSSVTIALPSRKIKWAKLSTHCYHTVTKYALRFRHAANLNPGFCPAAFRLRYESHYPQRNQKFSDNQMKAWPRCLHCGLGVEAPFPKSYTTDWPNYPQYVREFRFECHISTTVTDNGEKLGCVLCWEHKGVWVEPMLPEAWGKHIRTHFESEGYEMCLNGKAMAWRTLCPAKKCTKIHA